MPGAALVTDSSSQLPEEARRRLGVTVVPMTITVDGVDHLEGVDLGVEDFYARLSDGAEVTTAAPSPGELLAAYESLAEGGAEAIVSVHLAASLSATVSAALVAARLSPVPVTVVDSGTAAFGVGWCVWAAADALAAGASAAEAAARAERVGALVENVFLVGVPSLADRAGRVTTGVTGDGQEVVPGVVPVLALERGMVQPVAEAAGLVEALDVIVSAVADRAQGVPQRIAVGDAAAPSLGAALATRLAALELAPEIVRYTLGPSVGAHTGAGTVGAVFHPLADEAPEGEDE
jgi:DegV family protein with EDD domain